QLSSGKWLRVGIREEGIYQITAERLRQLGIRISPDEIPTLKLLGTGGEPLPETISQALEEQVVEQPIIVRTTEKGELRDILFYGAAAFGFRYRDGSFEHFLNPYSEVNYYLLTWGGRPGLRAFPIPPPKSDSVVRPSFYVARVFREDELYQPFALPSGRDWLGPLVDPAVPVVYTTPLPDLERSGEVLYRFVVVNRATVPAQFQVFEGGHSIWSGTLGAVSGYTEAVATPAVSVGLPAARIAADNRSVVRFTYGTAGASGLGHVDWLEIHYPRRFVAVNNTLEFFTEPSWEGVLEFSIAGFSGEERWGFEVTDRRRPRLLQNLAGSPDVFVFRTEQHRGNPRRFFISGRLLTPVLERAEIQGLREQQWGVPLIIITHRDLQASAQAYRRYREASGIASVIVPVDAIFDEFAAGMPDPTALRNFLAYAVANCQPPPRYVLLWGSGHHDYKGITTRRPSYVPTYQSTLALPWSQHVYYNAVNSYTTDDFYTWLQGEDPLPDIALGRLPVSSESEGNAMVEKLRSYELRSSQGVWRIRVTLVADDGPTSIGNTDYDLHTKQSEGLSALLPSFVVPHKIYLAQYPAENIPGGRRKPGATQELVAAVNSGTVLLNWIGHGNPRLWAHEQIFERETTTPLFQNRESLFFLTAATCDFARFDNPQVPSGAEALLISRAGAAIGVFAATRLVYATPNAAIMSHFYRLLFQRQEDSTFAPVGDVYMVTKLQRFDTLNDRKYVLLADPVMRLLLPSGSIQVDSINGVAVADSLPSLAAWSHVRLSGRVFSPLGQVWKDFS
ncbi:MAG: C25 family cysteine peptidase, partial [Bacteroidota bacterium]|nr:C25 family cysteine peptidase [Bacteroidota bacterium]